MDYVALMWRPRRLACLAVTGNAIVAVLIGVVGYSLAFGIVLGSLIIYRFDAGFYSIEHYLIAQLQLFAVCTFISSAVVIPTIVLIAVGVWFSESRAGVVLGRIVLLLPVCIAPLILIWAMLALLADAGRTEITHIPQWIWPILRSPVVVVSASFWWLLIIFGLMVARGAIAFEQIRMLHKSSLSLCRCGHLVVEENKGRCPECGRLQS